MVAVDMGQVGGVPVIVDVDTVIDRMEVGIDQGVTERIAVTVIHRQRDRRPTSQTVVVVETVGS